MNSPNNPHDRFFKAVFSREDVAADFLRHHLPADIASLMTPGSLAIRKDSFVENDLGEHYSDLLYSVTLHNGQPGFVYVLFEHKSCPEPRIALDLLRYLAHGTDKLSRTELASNVELIFSRGNHIMSTIAAEWIQEGRQEGRQEGQREEAAELLRRQLACRFGPLPAWAEVKLKDATTATLESWAIRILTAQTLDAFFE